MTAASAVSPNSTVPPRGRTPFTCPESSRTSAARSRSPRQWRPRAFKRILGAGRQVVMAGEYRAATQAAMGSPQTSGACAMAHRDAGEREPPTPSPFLRPRKSYQKVCISQSRIRESVLRNRSTPHASLSHRRPWGLSGTFDQPSKRCDSPSPGLGEKARRGILKTFCIRPDSVRAGWSRRSVRDQRGDIVSGDLSRRLSLPA